MAVNPHDQAEHVVVVGREGKELVYATHNFADRTTWYAESERVLDAALSYDGSEWWTSGHAWIDMIHGKVFDEDALRVDQGAHGYAVTVRANGVLQEPRAPFAVDGGAYIVDYVNGRAKPVTAGAWDGKEIRADYSRPAGYGWTLVPATDRCIVIEKSEIQVSVPVQMNDSIVLQIFGLVDFFAPERLQANGGLLPAGTPIEIERTTYKTVYQLIDEAAASYPEIPALGGLLRGSQVPMHILQFHYAAVRTLYASLGMYLRVSVEAGHPFGGDRVTGTFYCLSRKDPGATVALEALSQPV